MGGTERIRERENTGIEAKQFCCKRMAEETWPPQSEFLLES